MYGNETKEFGDYQTPIDFCTDVCKYIKANILDSQPDAILEPTCGVGHFLTASLNIFSCSNVYGIEINPAYVQIAKDTIPLANIKEGNIFDINTREICRGKRILVIGNPPWATNSNLSYNLPKKLNFKGLRGIEALTGSANFDICEYIILSLVDEYKFTCSTICMLCKTSVARNIILEIDRNRIPYKKLEILNFNSNHVFGISAAACIFILQLIESAPNVFPVSCNVKDFDTGNTTDTLTVCNGILKSSALKIDLEGRCQLSWRQGVKHDCGKIMELDYLGGSFVNKLGENVTIESSLVFPLIKSSHFKKPIINSSFKKYVIVTQKKPKQDTDYIQEQFPLTWNYLNKHLSYFTQRKSSIYKNAPNFAMFGIGDYSFAPYKVGVSGFYKKPLFSLLYSDKPVMTDDTAYFLAFDSYGKAYSMMLLLNSSIVQDFLVSIAFLDNKRPYTVKVLSRLDLKKCIEQVSFESILQTEAELNLSPHITNIEYEKFKNWISSL